MIVKGNVYCIVPTIRQNGHIIFAGTDAGLALSCYSIYSVVSYAMFDKLVISNISCLFGKILHNNYKLVVLLSSKNWTLAFWSILQFYLAPNMWITPNKIVCHLICLVVCKKKSIHSQVCCPGIHNNELTSTESVFCPGSLGPLVPVLEPMGIGMKGYRVWEPGRKGTYNAKMFILHLVWFELMTFCLA